MSSKRAYKLTSQEYTYLLNSSCLPDAVREALKSVRQIGRTDFTVELPLEIAKEWADALTERLARVGFDREYNPTAEGKILESLIDSLR